MNAGFLESKVYTLDVGETGSNNENERDFRRRFCDQDTSGGGWTVARQKWLLPVSALLSSFVLLSTAGSMCLLSVLL